MSEQLQLGGGILDRFRELDDLVTKALRQEVLDEGEKEALRVIAGHRGAANAIRGEEIAFQLGLEWKEQTRRWIAGVVETAILVFKIPIGGLRVKPYGYFLIVTPNDLDVAIGPLHGEFLAILRRLRVLTSKKSLAEFFGQEMLKLDEETKERAA